jgi:hypothetical protein
LRNCKSGQGPKGCRESKKRKRERRKERNKEENNPTYADNPSRELT